MPLFGPNFKACCLDYEQLSKEQAVHFDDQRNLPGNKGLDKDRVEEFLRKGVTLWNEVVDAAKKKYKENKAVIFCINDDNRVPDNNEITLYDPQKKHTDIRLRSRDDTNKLLVSRFISFANETENRAENGNEEAWITTGEATTPEVLAKELIAELLSQGKRINCIAGPIMVCRNKELLNELIINLLTMEESKHKLSMHKNRLAAPTSLYSGYFHCYIVGDNVFAETPHKFDSSNRIQRYRFIFNDKDIADKLRGFMGEYREEFASEITSVEQAKKDFCTVNTEKDKPSLEHFFKTRGESAA